MKRIKLKPLRTFNPKSIPTSSRKHITITADEAKSKDIFQFIAKEVEKAGGFMAVTKNDGPAQLMQKITGASTGENFVFPEIDPVLVYFNLALKNIEAAEERKQLFLKAHFLNAEEKFLSFIDYFESSASAVANLMQTLEAFFNRLMPEGLSVTVNEKTYNKSKIEKMSFDWKLEHALPVMTGSDFRATHPNETADILRLKELRNRLIHLKVIAMENLTSYQQLSDDLFNTDFGPYVTAIKVFIDSYATGLVEEIE